MTLSWQKTINNYKFRTVETRFTFLQNKKDYQVSYTNSNSMTIPSKKEGKLDFSCYRQLVRHVRLSVSILRMRREGEREVNDIFPPLITPPSLLT